MQGFFVTKHVMTSGFTRIKGSNYYTRWALLLVMNALAAPINGLKNMGHNRGLFHPYEWSHGPGSNYRPLSGDLYGWHQGSSREGSPGDSHRGEGVADENPEELIGNKRHKQQKKHQPKNYPQGTNISHQTSCLKMIFLFPRWDMLNSLEGTQKTSMRTQSGSGRWFFSGGPQLSREKNGSLSFWSKSIIHGSWKDYKTPKHDLRCPVWNLHCWLKSLGGANPQNQGNHFFCCLDHSFFPNHPNFT